MLVRSRPSSVGLGRYAGALEVYPVQTLTVTGALAGAGLGIGVGWLLAKLFKGNPVQYMIETGGVTAAAFAISGYAQGRNLQAWLQSSS